MLFSFGESRSHSRALALENDRLGKDISCACSGMAVFDRNEVIREP